jgi:hypothetical protein
MDRISGDVRRELQRFTVPGSLPALLEAWPAAVGAQVVRHAWPARVQPDGTLHVAASSSTWAFELQQLAPEILERLRELLGEDCPRLLRFAPGHVPETGVPEDARPVERQVSAPLSPGRETRAEAARLVASIDNEELRSAVRRAVESGLARARLEEPSGRPVW